MLGLSNNRGVYPQEPVPLKAAHCGELQEGAVWESQQPFCHPLSVLSLPKYQEILPWPHLATKQTLPLLSHEASLETKDFTEHP